MIAANQPMPSVPGERVDSDYAARPPWSDRRYLYPHAWQPPRQPAGSGPSTYAAARLAAELLGPVTANGHDQASAHAFIGDELRLPAAWCELGNCISRFTDAAALGELDIRSRALAAGWRHDALGRLACPGCVQHDPTFQISYPLVPWSGSQVSPAVALPAEPLPEPTEAADVTWISNQPRLHLATPTDEAERRSARFWHREAGRHRRLAI